LYRDLRETEHTNQTIARLRSMVSSGQLTEVQLKEVLRVLDVKPIEVIAIRPAVELPGNPFSGFADLALREHYIDAGREAARAALPSLTG